MSVKLIECIFSANP